MMTLSLIMVMATALWVLLGRVGVHMASGGEDSMPPIPLFLAGLIGGGLGLLAAPADPVISAVTVVICSGLFSGALVDRQTGWAPDVIVFPIVVLAFVLGAASGGWDITPGRAAIYATCGYWAFQAAWIGVKWKYPDFSLPPPGDLVAIVIPMLFFGLDPRFVATMMAMALVLLLARQFRPVSRLFSRPELIVRIEEEDKLDYPDWCHAITFLALAFPVTALSLVIFSLV